MPFPRSRPRAPDALPRAGVVGIAAPLGRDGELIANRLRGSGLKAQAYADLDGLCDAFEADRLGALVLTAEAVKDPGAARLRELLWKQPTWSDIPVLVLAAPGQGTSDQNRLLARIGARPSATVLERPVSAAVLVGVTHLAMLARERQLDVRDVLLELKRANERLEARVEARTREVRRLAADLTLAEQTERRRVAHLLHDDLQQRLYGLSVTLDLLGNATEGEDQTHRLLKRAKDTLAGTVSLTRTLSHGLAPPLLGGEGVVELIGWVASRAESEFGIEVDIEMDDGVAVAQEAVRILLGQILGELLFNAAKHSGTERVRVVAREAPDPSMVRVVVEDEGTGFDPSEEREGLGLTSSRERAQLIGGRVTIDSAPGAGTRVTVEVPSGEAPDTGGDGVSGAGQTPELKGGSV